MNPDVDGADVWNGVWVRAAERVRYASPEDGCHYWPALTEFLFRNEAGDKLTLILPADVQVRKLEDRTGESIQSTMAGTSESSIPAPTQDKQPEPVAAGQSSSTSSKSTLGYTQDKPQPVGGPVLAPPQDKEYGCPAGFFRQEVPSRGGAEEFDSDESPPGLCDATSGEESESDLIRIGELRDFTKTNKGKRSHQIREARLSLDIQPQSSLRRLRFGILLTNAAVQGEGGARAAPNKGEETVLVFLQDSRLLQCIVPATALAAAQSSLPMEEI